MRVSKTWIMGCLVYAGLAAGLAGRWTGSAATGFSGAEAAAFVVTAPASVTLLPVTYVVLAAVQNIAGTGAGAGPPAWPVVLGYSGWFALLAIVNAAVLTLTARLGRPHRAAKARERRPPGESGRGLRSRF